MLDRASLLKSRWIVKETRRLRIDSDGILKWIHPVTSLELPYIPTEVRDIILVAYHESLGHGSEKKMFDLLRSRYYWPGMLRDVKLHVAECHECTLAKPPTR